MAWRYEVSGEAAKDDLKHLEAIAKTYIMMEEVAELEAKTKALKEAILKQPNTGA